MIRRLWEALEPGICGAIIGAVFFIILPSLGRWLVAILP